MSIHVHATYKAGVIYPDRPLNLPENSAIDLTVIPVQAPHATSPQPDADDEDVRPAAPRFSADELRARLREHAVSVGTLPVHFSRADIYNDHD
jgi:hypothetical protein